MSAVESGLLVNPVQTESPAVIIRTGGGNAPSLMALRVLDRININRTSKGLLPIFGVFPVSSDRQIRMLNSEATDPTHILVDPQYAAIVDPYISTHGRFNDHINTVVNKSVETKRALMQRFGPNAEPFDAMSLGLGESVTINPREIVGVLDAGSRYPSTDHPEHEFFFPVLASKLWQGLRREQLSYDPLLRVDDSSLKVAIEKMKEVERGYNMVWLSLINSFSYRSLSEGVTDIDEQFEALKQQPKTHLKRPIFYTPPMSPNTNDEMPTDDVEHPSIFVMFSGTGSSIAETNQLIPQIIAADYDVIVPESAIRFGDVTEENMPLVKIANSPSVIFHPNVHGVVARPGFGTVWDDENAGIETMRPPHTPGDDFEMVVNARTLDKLGLGQELRPGEIFTADDFRRKRVEVYHKAQALRERQIAKFRTKDGLKVVADGIARRMMRGRGQEVEIIELTDSERLRILTEERALLPDLSQGPMVPFRGRYKHIDELIIGRMHSGPDSPPTTILEYEPGMFDSGSPSAHDTIDVALRTQNNVEVTVVTSAVPKAPNYPEVVYEKNLGAINEQFDIVKVFHVGEMFQNQEDYLRLRNKLAERVKEGGYFFETQYFYAPGVPDFKPPHHIAIYQKVDGEFIHIMDLPDGRYPKTSQDLQDFCPGPKKLIVMDDANTTESYVRAS